MERRPARDVLRAAAHFVAAGFAPGWLEYCVERMGGGEEAVYVAVPGACHGLYRVSRRHGCAVILAIATVARRRGRGHALALVEHMRAREPGCVFAADALPGSLGFWLRAGFRQRVGSAAVPRRAVMRALMGGSESEVRGYLSPGSDSTWLQAEPLLRAPARAAQRVSCRSTGCRGSPSRRAAA